MLTWLPYSEKASKGQYATIFIFYAYTIAIKNVERLKENFIKQKKMIQMNYDKDN